MRFSFKTLLCVFLIFCINFSVEAGETLKIAVDDDFPPFSFSKNGETTGIDVDIVNELGKRLGINFEITLMPWKRLLFMTQNGEFEGSMSLFKTNEREKFAIFTHPIHYSTFVLFVKKGNEFNFTSIKDLYGKTIMKDAGFSIGYEFDQAIKEKKIKIFEIFEFRDFFWSIINKDYDAFVNNLEATLFNLGNEKDFMKYNDQISYLPKPMKTKCGAFLVLSKKSKLKNKNLIAREITKNLIEMENDGTYLKITSKYLKKINN